MNNRCIIHKGIISYVSKYDHDSTIYLDGSEESLIEILQEQINGKKVSVRYFVAGKPETKAVLIEGLIQKLYGDADAEYDESFSEYTGYLYTDQQLNIGGHNLFDEMKQNDGKFLYLEIDIHE